MKPLIAVCLFVLGGSLLSGLAEARGSNGAILAGFEPSAAQLAKESRGSVTVRLHGSDQSLKTVQAQTVVDAPAPIVWRILTDYPDYPKLFPRIATSEIRHVNGIEEHYTVLRYPWPYSRRWVLNAIQSDHRHWTLRWHRIAGTIVQLVGEWQLRPQGDHTVLRYGVRIDPGLTFIPTWVVNWGTQVMTPSILRAVARAAERRARADAARSERPTGPTAATCHERGPRA